MVSAVSRRDKGKRQSGGRGAVTCRHVCLPVESLHHAAGSGFFQVWKKIMWKLYWSINRHPYFDTQIFAALKVISVMNVSVNKRSKMNGVSGLFGEQLASIQNYW